MESKQVISMLLIFLGIVGLIIGLFGVFGPNVTHQNPWIFTILGALFFLSGIGLMKTVRS